MMRTQLLPSKRSPSGEGCWDINELLLNDAINPIMGVYFGSCENTEEKNPTVQRVNLGRFPRRGDFEWTDEKLGEKRHFR